MVSTPASRSRRSSAPVLADARTFAGGRPSHLLSISPRLASGRRAHDSSGPLGIFLAACYVMSYLESIHAVRKILLGFPAAALLLLVLQWRSRPGRVRARLPVAMLAFLAWCLVSYFWSADHHDSAHQVLEYVALALAGLLPALGMSPGAVREAVVLGSKTIIVITYASLVVAYHSATAPPALDPVPGWHGPVGGKNILGLLMAIALISIGTESQWRRRTVAWMVAAAVLLFGSQSGAGLSLALMALAVVLMRQALRGATRRSVRLLYEVLASVTTLAGVLFLVTDFPAATHLLGKNATLTGRTRIWDAVSAAIPHHLMFGLGFAGVWYEKVGATLRLWDAIGFAAYEAHDAYLDILLQLGVVGLVLMVVAIAAAGRRVWPGLWGRDTTRLWAALVLAALVVEGAVESDLLSTEILLLAAVVTTSLAWGRDWSSRHLPSVGESRVAAGRS